jgi:hypothetical protein
MKQELLQLVLGNCSNREDADVLVGENREEAEANLHGEILSTPPARGSQAAEGPHPPPGSGRRRRRPGRMMGRRPTGKLDLSSAPRGPACLWQRLLSWSGHGRTAGARAQLRRASPGPADGGALPPVPWIFKLGPRWRRHFLGRRVFAKCNFTGLGRRGAT